MAVSKKNIISNFLYHSGILRFLVACQSNKIPILMLHGVVDPKVPSPWKPLRPRLTTGKLRQTLRILSRYYTFISLPAAIQMLNGEIPPQPRSLVLTFDDGYRNNILCAMRVLRQFKAPAAIFLITHNITEQKPLWFDRLDFAVQAIGEHASFPTEITELAELDFSDRNALSRSFITFIRRTKGQFNNDIAMRNFVSNLTDRLEQASGHGLEEIYSDDPYSAMLTWEEVRNADTDVHFASHGVNHLQLGLVSTEIARHELSASQEAIEYYTGQPCRHLAYPNGSFTADVISLAKECNYISAVTTIQGLNKPGNELLKLQRLSFPHAHSPAADIAAALGLTYRWQIIKEHLR
jgi:peptidoglycan/xylan/chitin deacetylase (PgdA/CDA1 family)